MTGLRLFEIEAPGRRMGADRKGEAVRGRGVVAASPTPKPRKKRRPKPQPPVDVQPTVERGDGWWRLVVNAPVMSVRSKKTGQTRLTAAWLTMNGRMYWRKKAQITAEWRQATALVARQVGLPVGQVRRAKVDVALRFATTQRRDTPNWHATAKVILDALTEGTDRHPGYGFLPDDAPKFLHCEECPHLTIGEKLPAKPYGPYGQVVVMLTDVSEAA